MIYAIVILAIYHSVWFYMYACNKLFIIKNKLWIEPIFAWYDFWVGLFWKKTPHLWYHFYLFILPTMGFSVRVRKPYRSGRKWYRFLEMSEHEVEEMMMQYSDE